LPAALIEALHDTLNLKPAADSQRTAQPEMVKALHVAKMATAMAQVSLLSLWTMAIAISAQSPCSRIAAHFTGPTVD
jgi:hypothetical protein